MIRAPIDLNNNNTNYDIEPTTGELLLITFTSGNEEQSDLYWILGWPTILDEMVTGR